MISLKLGVLSTIPPSESVCLPVMDKWHMSGHYYSQTLLDPIQSCIRRLILLYGTNASNPSTLVQYFKQISREQIQIHTPIHCSVLDGVVSVGIRKSNQLFPPSRDLLVSLVLCPGYRLLPSHSRYVRPLECTIGPHAEEDSSFDSASSLPAKPLISSSHPPSSVYMDPNCPASSSHGENSVSSMVFADSRGRRTGITALVIERDVVPVDTKSVNQGEVESIAKRTGTTTLAGTITQSPFQEVYLFNCTLGCGAHGRVYLAQEKCTETFFAIKVLTKRSQYSSPGGYDRAVTEKECMRLAMEEALPFVMPLIRAWDENENVFMVMPLCPETLLDRLSRETAKTINRRLLAAELLLALKDLHDRHIVHRDLKPENVFLTFGGHIRLGDLGLVYVVEEELSSTEFYDYEIFEGLNGTIGYLAPELLDPDYADQPYTPKVDIYSMGLVLLQVFLWKDYPYFEAYTLQGQWRRMQDDQQRWRKRIPDENAVDLLSQMLCPDPRARPTVDELLYHPFFMGHHATSQVGDHESHPAVGGPPTKGFKWKAVYDCQYPCADMYPFQGPQFDSPTVSDDSAEDAISDAQRAECMHQEREKERASRKGRLQSEFTYGCERGWETDPRHGTFTSTWIPKSMWMDGEVVLIEDDASA